MRTVPSGKKVFFNNNLKFKYKELKEKADEFKKLNTQHQGTTKEIRSKLPPIRR